VAAARRAGFDAAAAWVATEDRAHYWPEAKVIHIAVVWERGSGRLLGVQAAGEGEVAKRVDVATQLILAGTDLERLAHLEHAYAPPFAPALDPLAVAAFAALNHEEGVEALPPFTDLGGASVIDLRLPEEREAQPFEGEAEGIPLGELDPETLPKAAELVLVCQRGTRSAEGVRALAAAGRRARYIGGGVAWRQVGRTEG
jgi:rhodanese-related sulfurtransferase